MPCYAATGLRCDLTRANAAKSRMPMAAAARPEPGGNWGTPTGGETMLEEDEDETVVALVAVEVAVLVDVPVLMVDETLVAVVVVEAVAVDVVEAVSVVVVDEVTVDNVVVVDDVVVVVVVAAK
jgi:hypothetical protein